MLIKRGGKKCHVCGSTETYITSRGYQAWHKAADPSIPNGYRCGRCYGRMETIRKRQEREKKEEAEHRYVIH